MGFASSGIYIYIYRLKDSGLFENNIKTHDSELRGKEEAVILPLSEEIHSEMR